MASNAAGVAAALRQVADGVAGLGLSAELDVTVHVQLAPGGDAVAVVDAVGVAVFGTGWYTTAYLPTAGVWHHTVEGRVGPLWVTAFAAVDPPVDGGSR